MRIDGVMVKASHVAYLLMTGEWPEHEVDHRNRRHNDNRWENIRPATKSENAINRVHPKPSGLPRGVSKATHGGYTARATIARKTTYLGVFETPEEAAAAYRAFMGSNEFLPV